MKPRIRVFTALLLLISSQLLADVEQIQSVSFVTDNGNLQGEDLLGKIVYVDFWASWCTPCLKSFPWMNTIQEKYKDQGLEVIAVNLDKEKSLAEKFINKVPASFTLAYDPAAELAKAFAVKGMPSSYIFSRNGKLVSSHIGFRESEINDYESTLKELLQTN